MNSIVYGRRRKLFTKSRTSYIQTSLGSNASLEFEEDLDGSTSSVSAKSAKSLKSYKSWKRAQRRKRRNQQKANSSGADQPAQMIEALDLSGEYGDTTGTEGQPRLVGETMKGVKSHPVAVVTSEASADRSTKRLPVITQSPLDPYYSSSPLTSSDESNSQGSQQRIHSGSDDIEDRKDNHRAREPYNPLKDPLNRRSYPFILEEGKEPGAKDDTDTFLVAPPVLVSEDNTQSLPAHIKGLNEVPFLGDQTRHFSLLSLSKLKDTPVSMDQPAYDEEGGGETDVFFSDQNGFTIALPANSPTVSTYAIDEEGTKFPQLADESRGSDMTTDESERKREHKRETYESPLNTEENRQRMRSLEMPGADIYFLPPLIAKAITNKAIHGDGHENHLRDKNCNFKLTPVLSGNTTEEESDGENVYMENAEDFLHDLQEKEFMGVPRIKATPEDVSDSGSVVTRESIDPIENILTGKDDVKADDKTFTLNGRAVITPGSGNTLQHGAMKDDKPISVEPEVIPAKTEAQEQSTEMQDMTPITGSKAERFHSHRVGDDRKCEVCNPKSANGVPDMSPDCCTIL